MDAARFFEFKKYMNEITYYIFCKTRISDIWNKEIAYFKIEDHSFNSNVACFLCL